jgi:group I intron endonuclease
MVKCGIYSITNIMNGKIYYGSTHNYYKRKKRHLRILRQGKHHNRHLQAAFNLYGVNSFVFRFELSVFEPFLLFIEQIYLDNNQDGYNIATNAQSVRKGAIISEETKQKLSAAHSGKILSQEHKHNISVGVLNSIRPSQHGIVHQDAKGYYLDKRRNKWVVDFRGVYKSYPIEQENLAVAHAQRIVAETRLTTAGSVL